jgi:hypothetical protein
MLRLYQSRNHLKSIHRDFIIQRMRLHAQSFIVFMALPLSSYSRTIPLRDQQIFKTHTAEGWRQSRRAHTGVPLAGKKLARVPSSLERSISKFVI